PPEARYGYATFANMIRDRPLEGNFLWLADIQERSRESLYIDLIHYSPEFLKKLATHIDRRLMEQDLYDQVLRPCYHSTGPRRRGLIGVSGLPATLKAPQRANEERRVMDEYLALSGDNQIVCGIFTPEDWAEC